MMRKMFTVTLVLVVGLSAAPAYGDGEEDRHKTWQPLDRHWMLTGHCPHNYELAGDHFTYYLDRQGAMAAQCGRRYIPGEWRSYRRTSDVTGKQTLQAYQFGQWIGTPDWGSDDRPTFGIQCRDNTLGIFVETGGYVGDQYRIGVPVVYSIGDDKNIKQNWDELISGTNPSAGAWMSDRYRAAFVKRLRANPTAHFTIQIEGYDGAPVGTARFNLTGIELRVEPVLQECGW